MAQTAHINHAHPETTTRSTRPVDLVHLAKQCLGDEYLELEVLRLFDTTIATYATRLSQSTSFDDLAINLHSIKGAAGGVGAWGVADLAAALEKDLRAGRPLAPERIGDLGMAIEEVRDFIARMLADEEA